MLGLGLWLPAPVAAELAAEPALRRRLRAELTARGLEVVTLNGFPYQAFQAPVVKHGRLPPGLDHRARLDYTLDLARVLADLLPDDAARGSISTLPLAWRDPVGRRRAAAAAQPTWTSWPPAWPAIAEGDRPGGAGRLRAGARLRGGDHRPGRHACCPTMDTERLGVCLDLAHLACAWEEPAAALARLRAAGLPVVKVQVSAALQADDPVAAAAALREYVEPRFLHQTRAAAAPARPTRRTRRTRPTTWTRRSPPGCPARGGCTTTCRCTRRPRRR